MKKFYLDTSIWIDVYEDRKGFNGEPLGDYAFNLLILIKSKNYKLITSDHLIKELSVRYPVEHINGIFKPFEKIITCLNVTKQQSAEAKKIAIEKSLPRGDVLHAILSRDYNLIMVARDNHFRFLTDLIEFFKPEELI